MRESIKILSAQWYTMHMVHGNSLSYKFKIFIKTNKGIILTFALLLIVIIFFMTAVDNASKQANSQSTATLERATIRAAVQCYAIEGFYPTDVQYLIDNYGLIVDKQKYMVYYDVFASNILPDIRVYEN